MVCRVFTTLGDNFSLWRSSALSGTASELFAGWTSCTGRRAVCSPVPPPQVALEPCSHLVQGPHPELGQGATRAAEAECCWVPVPPSSAASKLPRAALNLQILMSASLSLLAVHVHAHPRHLAGKAAVVAVLFCHSQKVCSLPRQITWISFLICCLPNWSLHLL